MKKNIKLIIVFLLFTFIFITGCEPDIETQESSIWERRQVSHSRINRQNTPVRNGLGSEFEVVKNLEEGQEVDVVAEIGDWYVVRLEDDSLGSVNESDAEPIVKPEEEIEEREETGDAPEGTLEEDTEEEIEPVDNSEEEQRMVNMVNEARQNNNLDPLEVDPELTRVARRKSQDMVDNDYFSHHSPTYGSPFDMLDHYDVEYLHAGENIASNPSVEDAHNSLMNSPGHRQNILNENYTHTGIGIVSSDRQGYMITQLFISQPR